MSDRGIGSEPLKGWLEVLQQKQGEKYQFEIIDLENNSGTRVEILIPEEK